MSISWSDRPNRGQGEGSYRLLRVGRSGSVAGIILNTAMAGTATHYWKGKTLPCSQRACEPCKEGFKPRWYGYLALWQPKHDQIAIAEITDSASDDLDRFRERNGTLRGAALTLTRQGQRPNGRILANITAGPLPVERLPPEFDVRPMLMRIWGINENHAAAKPPRSEPVNRIANTNGKHTSHAS